VNIKDVSFIIPFKNTTVERLNNCIVVLKWLGFYYDDAQVIIVENGTKTNLKKYNKSVKYIWMPSEDDSFNKSKTINMGVSQAENELLIILDADMIMDPKDINICIQSLRKDYEAINPFNCLIDLTEDKTRDILKAKSQQIEFPLVNINFSNLRQELNFCAAIVMMRKDSFYYIGGWPEEFKGWGGEDDVVAYKIERLLKCKTYPFVSYHLYHKRNPISSSERMPGNKEYINNCDIMDRIIRMSDEEFIEYCNKSRICLLNSSHASLKKKLKTKYDKNKIVIKNPKIDISKYLDEEGKVKYYPITY
jgi:predicted glycosyltransferase involved in capsule biosynthesis